MDKGLVIPCSFPTLLCCISTYLGNAVDRDEIWVVFCHNLGREAFIYWSLEEIQNKAMLHTGHCSADWSTSAATKINSTEHTPLTGTPSKHSSRGSSSQWFLGQTSSKTQLEVGELSPSRTAGCSYSFTCCGYKQARLGLTPWCPWGKRFMAECL